MISITIDGVSYQYPSNAADTNWAALQVAAMQALAAAVNSVVNNPTWVALTPINSWTNVTGDAPAAYYVAPNGDCHLRFALESGANDTVAFVLPSAAHPQYPVNKVVFCVDGPSACVVKIATNGDVTIADIGGSDVTTGVYADFSFSTVAGP